MKLCNSSVLARHAASHGYGVPALNTNGATYDITKAIIEACEEMQSPLIIQCYEPNLGYRGYEYYTQLVHHLAKDCTIPISIQLDHGHSVTSVIKAVKAGFTTVMIDYAGRPVHENIEGTNAIIDLVRPLGVAVESEVGNIIKSSDDEGKKAGCASIDEVKHFVAHSDLDLLAVAVGTTHGIFESQSGIDFDLINKISHTTDVPLVLHGTCGVSLEDITSCVKAGMGKINFGECFRMNYIKYFNEVSQTLDHQHHAWAVMQECKNMLKKDIKDIIRAVGSEGYADKIKL